MPRKANHVIVKSCCCPRAFAHCTNHVIIFSLSKSFRSCLVSVSRGCALSPRTRYHRAKVRASLHAAARQYQSSSDLSSLSETRSPQSQAGRAVSYFISDGWSSTCLGVGHCCLESHGCFTVPSNSLSFELKWRRGCIQATRQQSCKAQFRAGLLVGCWS